MQVKNNHNIIKRMLYYGSKLYSHSIKEGIDYDEAKPVICIAILNYTLFKNTKNFFSESNFIMKNTEEELLDLNNEFKLVTIELPKFRKIDHDLTNKLDQWLATIDFKETKEVIEVMEKNNRIKETVMSIRELTADELIEADLDRQRDDRFKFNSAIKRAKDKGEAKGIEKGIAKGIEKGRAEGRAEGIAEGKIEGLIKTAKKLKEMNMPLEQIKIVTGLTKEQIEKI